MKSKVSMRRITYRVAKYDVTKTKICELMAFVEIIREVKTKHVSLLKIRMLLQILSELLTQLCSNLLNPWTLSGATLLKNILNNITQKCVRFISYGSNIIGCLQVVRIYSFMREIYLYALRISSFSLLYAENI